MSHTALLRLKHQARRYGITHEEIAAAAQVGRTLVSHVLAGRAKSGNVISTTRRLIAARRGAGLGEASRVHAPGRAGAKRSTARSLLKHATGWAGDDLDERLAEVTRLRTATRL